MAANPQFHVDIDLEDQIDRAAHDLHHLPTPGERRAAWERLKTLIEMRSPERVAEMERMRGLR